jgi:hypothetical protein
MEKDLFDLHQKDLTASDITDSIYPKDDLESCDLDLSSQLSSQRLFLQYTCRRRLGVLGALPKRLLRAGSAILPSYLRNWNSGWQAPGESQESHAISVLRIGRVSVA